MSVYIPGLEKPSDCENCIFCYDDECLMHKPNEYRSWPEEYKNCPLVPVPEHGDLIDKQYAYQNTMTLGEHTRKIVLKQIDVLPVVIPADKEGEQS